MSGLSLSGSRGILSSVYISGIGLALLVPGRDLSRWFICFFNTLSSGGLVRLVLGGDDGLLFDISLSGHSSCSSLSISVRDIVFSMDADESVIIVSAPCFWGLYKTDNMSLLVHTKYWEHTVVDFCGLHEQ